MSKLRDWIEKVASKDRRLAALLRGLVTVEKGDGVLTFVWHAEFHKGEGGRMEEEIKAHLGQLAGFAIRHITLAEKADQDPMLAEALALGARVKEA